MAESGQSLLRHERNEVVRLLNFGTLSSHPRTLQVPAGVFLTFATCGCIDRMGLRSLGHDVESTQL